MARQYNDYQHPQELIRIRPERPVRPPLNNAPPDAFAATKAYGYDYGAHWNFAPNLPIDLVTNYTYDSPANDPVIGTADSFFTTTGDAKWYCNGNGVLVQGSANGMIRDFDANGNCLGWLIEPITKTNLCLQSDNFSITWSPTRSSVTPNAILGPDGVTMASKLVENSAANNSHSIGQSIAFTSGTTYALSVYVKAAERGWALVQVGAAAFTLASGAYFNLATGEVGSSNNSPIAYSEKLANGWWRLTVVKTATATASANVNVFIATADSTILYNGDGASGLYISRYQVEAGPRSTSYIPTTVASAARAADRASLTLGSWFSQSAGTIYAKCRLSVGNKGSNQFVVRLSDNSNANDIDLYSGSTGLGSLAVNKASGAAGLSTVAGAIADRTNERLIGAWSANDMRAALNGTLGNLDTSGPIPTALTRLDIGCDQSGTNACDALWMQTLDIWQERKVDADLSSLSLNP